jgi:WD40-like Beta Propeller Repeat
MRRERELERRLSELPMPGEAEAEERSWEVVRAAYADRTPVRPTYRARRFALAAAIGAALLAIGLSPAGAKMGDWVRDVVGEEDAKPELKTLPAAGEILVEGADGVWIVEDDGSKRRLGDYDEATWSPNGLYVASTDGNRLAAVTPEGDVRWDITAPARIHDPRWAGTEFDTRIAYRSGGDLWVVDGDGSDERLIAQDVAPVAPAWRPLGDTKLAPPGAHVLAYVDGVGEIRAIDVDTGRDVPVSGLDEVPQLAASTVEGRARSPISGRTAVVQANDSRSRVFLAGDGPAHRELLFSGPGRVTGPTWSPDGRWILVGWVDADQWLFINADQPRRVVAFDDVAEQFDGTAPSDFPRVAGWALPER